VILQCDPVPDFENNLPQEAEGKPSPEDLEDVEDLLLFVDLEERPEVDWSRPEMRRMRKFLARLKGP
jgi:hypothetical protein